MAAVQLVTYDLRKRKDYPELFKALNTYPTRWHCLDSVWLLVTPKTAAQVRDHLIQHIDSDDLLFVTRLGQGAGWTLSFSEECREWLKKHLADVS